MVVLTQDRLRQVIHYCQASGSFTWKKRSDGKTNWNARYAGTAAGSLSSDGYLQVRIDGKRYSAHRLAWLYVYGSWPVFDTDHKNGNRLDNRILNLRDVPHQENMQNARKPRVNSMTGLLGASFDKQSGKYRAQIRFGGKVRHLGYFPDPESAHAAYLSVKREYHDGCTI